MKKLFTILCIAICLNVSANTINVPAQYSTIQAGINSSNNGDTILVANGTYYETNITFGGKEVVLLSENGPLLTIIDGSNSGGIFDCNSGETFNTEINGFTIQNGQANEGAAIHIINSSYLTVKNCIVKNNPGTSRAAITIGQESPAGIHIYNCTFDNNSGYYGGAIFNEESGNTSSIFENCIFKNNSANRGGAVYGTRNSIFKYCVFYNNYSNGTVNCVIFNEGGYPTLQNCTFYNNTGYAFARNSNTQNTIIRNCIIQNNAGTFTEITNSNTINIEYSNEQSNNSGIGNFNQSALFVNTANNDFHLQSNSPCIDSGNPALVYNDPDGTRNDIGAYYYHQILFIAPPHNINTIKVYPNPANDIVIIDNGNYANMSNYTLKIVNSLGQDVFNSLITIPQFQIPVNTLGTTGLYFIQILDPSSQIIDTRKLILN